MDLYVNGEKANEGIQFSVTAELAAEMMNTVDPDELDMDELQEIMRERMVRTMLLSQIARQKFPTVPKPNLKARLKELYDSQGGKQNVIEFWAEELGMDESSLERTIEDSVRVDLYYDAIREEMREPSPLELQVFFAKHPELFEDPEVAYVSVIVRYYETEEEALLLRAEMDGIVKRMRQAPDEFEEFSFEYSDFEDEEELVFQVERGEMPKVLDSAIFSLEEGGISELVVLPEMMYIVKMFERVPAGRYEFEVVKDEVVEEWYAQQTFDAIDELVNEALKGAVIEVR